MPLFPNLGPQYYNEQDRSILTYMEKFYTDSITLNQSFWHEAAIDTAYESGDQTLWGNIYGNISTSSNHKFNFNHIRRNVNMVSGYQRRNRKSTIAIPIENADNQTADQFTKILYWINNKENILETISDSFYGALVTGMNLLHVWVDYRLDPISGDIKVDNCPYNSFLIDPYFRKADLSDCNGIWKRSYLTKQEAISLLPDYKEEIINLNTNSGSGQDGKFQFMPEATYNGNDLLSYDEFYYRAFRLQNMLVDTETGEVFEWRTDNDEKLNTFLETYPQVTIIKQQIPTVKLAIVVQGKVFYNDINPAGIDIYPFIPVLSYFNPQMSNFEYRIQGMVRGLRSSQFLYNRHREIQLDMVESRINTGYKYKENALVDPSSIFLSGQGRGIALKDNALMTDVEQIIPHEIPQSMFQLSEFLAKDMMNISGVNEELLGSAVDDKAGVLAMLRQGAGLTTLQLPFDHLDRSQKLLGKLCLSIIQSNFTPGKIQRILNEQPSEQFYSKTFGVYDIAIEEGLNTTTQKQMQFVQLLQLKEIGVPIPDETLLDAATIQNKKELIEKIEQIKQSEQQSQENQMQFAMEEQKARTNLANARAVADQGLGMERISRISENESLAYERRAEAVKDQSQAALNRVKALKELDDIDISQIEKLISLLQVLKSEETPIAEGFNNPVPQQQDILDLKNAIGTPGQEVPGFESENVLQ